MIEKYKVCYGLYDRNATAGLFGMIGVLEVTHVK